MRTLIVLIAACLAIMTVFLWGTRGSVKHSEHGIDEIAAVIAAYQPPVGPVEVTVTPNVDPLTDVELLESIVANEMLRLDLAEQRFRRVYWRAETFFRFVKNIESNGDRYAKAATSSAMSFFQFTVPSVPTAVTRLENYMARHYLGALPEWAAALREDPHSLYDVSERRQSILVFANIVEQTGSDANLRKYLEGDSVAAKAIYYAHHHTDPDAATLRRTEQIFSVVYSD